MPRLLAREQVWPEVVGNLTHERVRRTLGQLAQTTAEGAMAHRQGAPTGPMRESCGTGERAGRLAVVRRIACRPARPQRRAARTGQPVRGLCAVARPAPDPRRWAAHADRPCTLWPAPGQH